MKKIFISLALITFFALPLTTCDIINDLLDDDEEEPQSTYEFYTNPTDPTIAMVTQEDGTEVMYFGTKDADGIPLELQMITVKYPGENDTYKVVMKEDGTPGKIITTEGSIFEFEPISEKEFYMSIVSSTGEIRIDTKVNIDSLDNLKAFDEAVLPQGTQPRACTEVKAPAYSAFSENAIQEKQKNILGNKLVVNMTICGKNVPSIYITPVLFIKPPVGQMLVSPGMGTGQGEYSFMLPQPSPPSQKIQEICSKAGLVLAGVCPLLPFTPKSAICPLISKLIEQQFSNAKDKASITNVCQKAVDILPKLCKIDDEVGLANFCEVAGEVYLNPNPDQYTYLLLVQAEGKMYEVPLDGFNPNTGGTITYDIPGEFNVLELKTDPKDPGPAEGYTAMAAFECPSPQGTQMTLSVTGSDGYSDAVTTTATTGGIMTLYVPGGAEKIRDVITFTANGQTWTTFVVF